MQNRESVTSVVKFTRNKDDKKTYRSLSAELTKVFSLEEIKAEVQWWKVFKNYIRGRSGVLGRTYYFEKMCGEKLHIINRVRVRVRVGACASRKKKKKRVRRG